MGATPTPKPTPARRDPAADFDKAIEAFSPRLPIAVAYSGGADSSALLLACARKWPGQVRAVHVHHGIQAAGDAFERHCVESCAALGLPLAIRRVDARHASGESPENVARQFRYEALAAAVTQEWGGAVQDIAVAHHADDQVETMLLALSRGAGLPGLAAMPARWERDKLTWHRPLLTVQAPVLRQWLATQHWSWVEDPSNTDLLLTRNRIRATLLPALADAFPHFRETFARSASHAAQAQQVLTGVALEDLELTGAPPEIRVLQRLSRPRQANALRLWLRRDHGTTATAAQLDELLDQVGACTTRGHAIQIRLGSGVVERTGPRLQFRR